MVRSICPGPVFQAKVAKSDEWCGCTIARDATFLRFWLPGRGWAMSVRPTVAAGVATATALLSGTVAAAVALALAAADQSGTVALALWVGVGAATLLVVGTAGGVIVAVRIMSASRSQSSRAITHLTEVNRSLASITSRMGTLEQTAKKADRLEHLLTDLQGSHGDQHEALARVSARLGDVVDGPMLERQLRSSTRSLERSMSSSARTTFWQTQGLLALYAALEPDRGLPPMRSWSVSPDLAAFLVDLVRDEQPSHIVETGSGVSTLLFALALRQRGAGTVTALEHREEFAATTRTLLANYGVEAFANLIHAPLVRVPIGVEAFDWYDVDSSLLPLVDVLLVDGPPQAVGPLSRYPAVPRLIDRLSDRCVVVIDDASREDEQAVVERWCSEYGLDITLRPEHERGTIVLRRRAGPGGPPRPTTVGEHGST
jgi:predicted O-methyltransferase YrrM